jgi:hypothetical protein
VAFVGKVVLYIPTEIVFGEQVMEMIKTIESVEQTEIYRTIDNLPPRLRQLDNAPSIAVLIAFTRKELSSLLSIRNLLSDIPTILVIPDREKETIAIGHTFFPRLLSFADRGFEDVIAVLRKILGIRHSKNY